MEGSMLRKNKLISIIAIILIISFVFVATGDAILWLLGGVIRAGVVAVTTFVSTPMAKTVIRSAINHVLLGGAAYWYFKRADGVPETEQYIQVDLANTKTELSAMKAEGKILPSAPPAGWGNYTSSPPGGLGDNGCNPYGGPYPCSISRHCDAYNSGKMCITTPAGGYATKIEFRVFTSWGSYYNTGDDLAVATAGQRAAYPVSDFIKDAAVEAVFADSALKSRIQDALGTDMQRGGTLVESPIPGEPVTQVGVDGASKEWGSGYAESELSAWLQNTPSYTSEDVGFDDSGIVAGLSSVKTSVDAAKTSVDAVKTSVDGLKNGLVAETGAGAGQTGASDAVPGKSIVGDGFDNSITQEDRDSISSKVTSFLANNPLTSLFVNSGISADQASACSWPVNISGREVTFSITDYAGFLNAFGSIILLLACVWSIFIALGRG